MQQFHFILKNEKTKSYRLIILILLVFHLLFFGYLFISEYEWTNDMIVLVVMVDVILFILARMALQKSTYYFSTNSIEKRKTPAKKYAWDQLSNVVLKDNLLTLDFKSNKLMQAEVEPHLFNENAFNTFAKQQLANHD